MLYGTTVESYLQSHINRLMREIEDAEAVLFATEEGLPVAFEARFNPDIVERIAALSAMLFSVSRRASDIAKMGDMDYMEVSLDMGKIFLYRINGEIFLTVLTSPETNVGLVRLLAREVADKTRQYMDNLKVEGGEG